MKRRLAGIAAVALLVASAGASARDGASVVAEGEAMAGSGADALAPPPGGACPAGPDVDDTSIGGWLRGHSELTRAVHARANDHRLQVRLWVPPSADAPCGRVYVYRPDAEYLYPASAIKLPTAIAALSRFEERPPRRATLDTPLRVRTHTHVERDGSTWDIGGYPEASLRALLTQTLVESGNTSFNALYDMAGLPAQNEDFTRRGFPSVRIVHRLAVGEVPAMVHRILPPVEVVRPEGVGPWLKIRRYKPKAVPPSEQPGTRIGRAHRVDGVSTLVPAPMEFAGRNAATLADLQRMLAALHGELGPGDGATLLPLSTSAVGLLVELMTGPLRDSSSATAAEREARFKPTLPGVLRQIPDRGAVRYTNKAGRAYGFHIENARIAHGDRVVYLAVGLYVNEDGVLNDDVYEYERVSFPFLQDLGEIVARELLLVP